MSDHEYVKITKASETLFDTTPEDGETLRIDLDCLEDYQDADQAIRDLLDGPLEGPDTMRLIRRVAQEFLSAHAEPLGF